MVGARSFTALAEWAADADQATRDALAITGVVPCESTFRRTLQNLDADALDDAAGGCAQQRTAPAPGTRRMVAVYGKTLRGSGTAAGPGRHLLAALDHTRGVVLGQVDVEAKTNEIPMFATLLDRVDLAGAVVTADALRAQRPSAPMPSTWSPSAARIRWDSLGGRRRSTGGGCQVPPAVHGRSIGVTSSAGRSCRAGLAGNAVRHLLGCAGIGCRRIVPGPCRGF